MVSLDIRLLGTFQVTLRGKSITNFATDKARALLVYLVVESEQPHRRDALAGLLWPDQPQRKARQSLRQALSHVRQAIEQAEVSEFLLVTRETVQFDPESDYWADVNVFSAIYEANRYHHHRSMGMCRVCLQRIEQMVTLYRGDFMEGFFLDDSTQFEEWALLRREWYHLHIVEALTILARYYERRGDYVQARDFIQRQVALEPWREEAHRQLMALWVQDGQRSAALKQYEKCYHVLKEELGVAPTAETTAFYEEIKASENLHLFHSAFPFSLLPSPFFLPSSPFSIPFIGREHELPELADMLAMPNCRLITLVGPGGIGKTRLAFQVAMDHKGCFADGIALVPLASIDSMNLMLAAIADTLQFSFYGSQDAKTQLLHHLRGKDLLLVLDNMDYLLEESLFLAEMLRYAPGVTLLVTSRERLNLQEEWVYSLEGLEYPAFDETVCQMDWQQVSTMFSAVKLFVQCAERADRRFLLSEQNVFDVLKVCCLVEGMPLALELAAAWTPIRTCAEIALDIEHSLDTLVTSLRNVLPRHRSVQASFEYSWRLLSVSERETLTSLGVFRGGFYADAAMQVAFAGSAQLAALVQKSLLRHAADGRYHIHHLLWQYVTEKLRAQSQQEIILRERHARYYAGFLQQREGALKGALQSTAIREIAADTANIRTAWLWAVTCLEQAQGMDAAGAEIIQTAIEILGSSLESFYLFYLLRNWYQEGEALLGRATTAIEQLQTPTEQARHLLGELLARQGKCCEFTETSEKARRMFERSLAIFRDLHVWRETALPLYGIGYIFHLLGQPEQATQYFQESLSVYRRVEDRWGIANVLSSLCMIARRKGIFAEAEKFGQESLTIRREIGDLRGIASSLNNLSMVYTAQGDYARSKVVLEESLDLCYRLEYKIGIANALTNLCYTMFGLGNPAAAEHFEQESLAVYRDIGDDWGVALSLNNLGCLALEQKAYRRARPLYEEAIVIYRDIGVKSGLANTLNNLGEVCAMLGESDLACRYLYEALVIAWDTGELPIVVEILTRLAPLFARDGQRERGMELLAVALAHPALLPTTQAQAAARFAELTRGLSSDRIAQLQDRARHTDLAKLVNEVLQLKLLHSNTCAR
ncbi:MAG: tetratricopeptide repeat protein [Anaerolineae bacterium]|nr:tetratricopeptide repeat protein [Anaerolineae bacterium]